MHAEEYFELFCLNCVTSTLVEHWAIGHSKDIEELTSRLLVLEFGDLKTMKFDYPREYEMRIKRLKRMNAQELSGQIVDEASIAKLGETVSTQLRMKALRVAIDNLMSSRRVVDEPILPRSRGPIGNPNLQTAAQNIAEVIFASTDITTSAALSALKAAEQITRSLRGDEFVNVVGKVGRRIRDERLDYQAGMAKFWLGNFDLNEKLSAVLQNGGDQDDGGQAEGDPILVLALAQMRPLYLAAYLHYYPYFKTGRSFREIAYLNPDDQDYLIPDAKPF